MPLSICLGAEAPEEHVLFGDALGLPEKPVEEPFAECEDGEDDAPGDGRARNPSEACTKRQLGEETGGSGERQDRDMPEDGAWLGSVWVRPCLHGETRLAITRGRCEDVAA